MYPVGGPSQRLQRPASDQAFVNSALSFQTFVHSHPEFGGSQTGRRILQNSGLYPVYAKTEEELHQGIEERKRAYQREQAWTQRQLQELREEQRRLKEERAKLAKAKTRWQATPPLPGTVTVFEPEPENQEDIKKLEKEFEELKESIKEDLQTPVPEVKSLESWQAPEYYMIREIVIDVVNQAVDDSEDKKKGTTFDRDALLAHRTKQKAQQVRSDLHSKHLAYGLQTDILEEAVSELLRTFALEYLTFHEFIVSKAEYLVMHSAEVVATKNPAGRTPPDPAYNLITETFHQMNQQRDQKKLGPWRHSQMFMYMGPGDNPDSSHADPDSDAIQLDMMSLRVTEKWPITSLGVAFNRYRASEAIFWENFTVTNSTIVLNRKNIGISSSAVSADQRVLALGTVRGDIISYDMMSASPRPLRYIRNEGTPDGVISLNWSLDGMRLTSCNYSGSAYIWSTFPGGQGHKDFREPELKLDTGRQAPSQFSLLLELDDTSFVSGPLQEIGAQTPEDLPSITAFHPSSTLLVSQNSLVIALATGDILKCNAEQQMCGMANEFTHIENVLHPLLDSSHLNTIGQGIPTEFFRGHKSPLVCLGFCGNSGDMVTVDREAYILIWKYNSRCISHFGWFAPHEKFQLELAERIFLPKDDTDHQVFFEDKTEAPIKKNKNKKKGQATSSPEVEAKRSWNNLYLKTLEFHNLFSCEIDQDKNIITTLMEPEFVPEHGCPFRGTVREVGTRKLLKHFTKIYIPDKLYCTRFIHCQFNTTSDELVFCLLFPRCLSRDPHLSFVTISLCPEVKVHFVKIELVLTDDEYYRCLTDDVCHFKISQMLEGPKSSYLILLLFGGIFIYSRNTGSLLLSSRPKDAPLSLHYISKAAVKLNRGSDLTVVHNGDKMSLVTYSESSPTAILLHLKDGNTSKSIKTCYTCYKLWKLDEPKVPVEVHQRQHQWLLDRDQHRHVELFMMRLVLQLADFAVERVDGEMPHDEVQSNMMADRLLADRYLPNLAKSSTTNAPSTSQEHLTEQGSQ